MRRLWMWMRMWTVRWIVVALLVSGGAVPAAAHDESQKDDPELQREVTRAEYANMLASQLKLEADKKTSYPDTDTHWAKDYIGAVCKAGLMTTYKGKFSPDAVITMEQAAVVMVRVLELPTDGVEAPKGRNISSWAEAYVAAALQQGAFPDAADFTKPLTFYDAITTMETIENYITEKEVWKKLRQLK
ncbi:S-layer homology domain-containing protein [Paenibacillus tarimensis]